MFFNGPLACFTTSNPLPIAPELYSPSSDSFCSGAKIKNVCYPGLKPGVSVSSLRNYNYVNRIKPPFRGVGGLLPTGSGSASRPKDSSRSEQDSEASRPKDSSRSEQDSEASRPKDNSRSEQDSEASRPKDSSRSEQDSARRAQDSSRSEQDLLILSSKTSPV